MYFFDMLISFYLYGNENDLQCLICTPFIIQELSATERYQGEDSYYKQLEKERRLRLKKYYLASIKYYGICY